MGDQWADVRPEALPWRMVRWVVGAGMNGEVGARAWHCICSWQEDAGMCIFTYSQTNTNTPVFKHSSWYWPINSLHTQWPNKNLQHSVVHQMCWSPK